MWRVAALLMLPAIALAAQSAPADEVLQRQLKQLFPSASTFSPKQTDPPHYKAFKTSTSGTTDLLGLAFWTTELEPLERGYDGPIRILVGLNVSGALSGIIVADHREPYGNFSVDTAEFAQQFAHKDIRDAFRVGADIDAVSRATISIGSATRAIKNSARRVARALLTPPPRQP